MQRARRIERFLSQPFFVAEQFTGQPGKYVPREESVQAFKEIVDGKHDDLPERAFYMKGTIDEVVEAAKGAKDEDEEEGENGDNGDGEENGNGEEG